MPLNRTWSNGLVDDDGSGTLGTIWNKSQINQFEDVIDAALAPLESPTRPVPVHHATHLQGGSDPISNVSSTTNGLAPQGSGDLNAFLRADGQWAYLSATAVAPHASRHYSAGVDPLDVKLLAGFPGGTATFLRSDGSFAVPPGGGGGGGNVTGPGSAVDNAVTRFDGASGTLIQSSNVTIDDAGILVAAGLGGTPLNASQLTSGSMPDARLSANVLKVTGGYPGGTTAFLRADGTFAVPAGGGGGAPAAHATTHQVGGSDVVSVLLLGGFNGLSRMFLRGDGVWSDTLTANAAIQGDLYLGGSAANIFFNANAVIQRSTADGADNGFVHITGGGGFGPSRGAGFTMWGNESSLPGVLQVFAGAVSASRIDFVKNDGSTVMLTLGGDGVIKSTALYADTTTSAANVFVQSDGRLQRSTSSLRYKTNVAPLDADDWRWLFSARPIKFNEKKDPQGRPHAGLAAEHVAAAAPMFVVLNAEGLPDEVAYGHLTAPIISALQSLDARIRSLEAR